MGCEHVSRPCTRVIAVALVFCLLSVWCTACSDPPGPPGDGGADAVADSPDEVSDAPDGEDALEDVASDTGADASDDGGDASLDAVPDAFDAGSDAPADQQADGPPGSNVCGDGWRDPLTEECDDGLAPSSGEDRACTSACTVVDRLAGNDPSARERCLGAGRHPVAAGSEGQAAVTVELIGEAGDEVQVVVHTFSTVGVRVGSAAWPGAVLDADPVVAALPSGGFAVAFTQLGADGDGLGIALARVSGDGTDVHAAGPANATTAFGQRSPDILWTGSHVVVGWEDESTIPRRVCTRRFSAQLAPVGGEACTADGVAASRVSLASLQGQLVTSWRGDDDETSSYRVDLPGGTWSSPPVASPLFDETTALAELDAETVLAVYCDGLGQMHASLLDASGTDLGEPMLMNMGGGPRFRPALAATADGVYLAWREPALEPAPGEPWDPVLDELWLQRLVWDGGMLDTSAEPLALPRDVTHQHGDQARPALAAAPYWPSGAVLAAWDDLTATSYGAQAEHGDVVTELIPTPVLRTPLAY